MAWTVLRTVTDSVSYVTAADHNETKANFDIVGGTDGATKTGNWYVSGNVGIGTTNPGAALEVRGSATTNIGSNAAQLWLSRPNGSTGFQGLSFRVGLAYDQGIYQKANSDTLFIGRWGGSGAWQDSVAIDTAGNVGIGTASPGQLLHVAGRVLIGGATTNSIWDINADSMGINRNISTGAIYDATGHAYQWQHTKSTTAASNNLTLQIYTPAGVGVAGGISIAGTGNVGIGTASPASLLTVSGDVQIAPATGGAYFTIKGVQAGQNAHLYYYTSNAIKWIQYANDSDSRLYVLDANSNDGVYIAQNATSWTANSDARLKDVIGPIENATAKVNALSGVKFTWKRDAGNPDAKVRVGLIAQDVLEVLPESVEADTPDIVTDEETGKVSGGLGVRYTELVPLLVNAIKELAQRVEVLER